MYSGLEIDISPTTEYNKKKMDQTVNVFTY